MRKNYFKKCAAALAALVLIFPMVTAQAVNTPVDLSNVKTAMIAESVSGQLIMEKNSKERVNVAGLTRLPSLLLVCELIDEGALNLSDKITVSEAAAAVKGPTAFVEPYEEIAASELLKAAVRAMRSMRSRRRRRVLQRCLWNGSTSGSMNLIST